MTQVNLFDAIKTVSDSIECFTDNQLIKFSGAVEKEINERKANNKWNPKIIKKFEEPKKENKPPVDESSSNVDDSS